VNPSLGCMLSTRICWNVHALEEGQDVKLQVQGRNTIGHARNVRMIGDPTT
jgi:hypothetical protein